MSTDTIMMTTQLMGMATFFYYAKADGLFGAGVPDLADALYPLQDPEDPFEERAAHPWRASAEPFEGALPRA